MMPDSGGDGLDNDCDGLIDEETTCVTGYATMKTGKYLILSIIV